MSSFFNNVLLGGALIVPLVSFAQNEIFRGQMYVKTSEGCGIENFRIGAYDDNLLIMLDKQILQFENCLHNEASPLTEADYLCRDKCGTNYQIKMHVQTNEGFIIFINNLLKKGKNIVISTKNICR